MIVSETTGTAGLLDGLIVPAAGTSILFALVALLIKTMWPQIGGWHSVLNATQASEQAAIARADEATQEAAKAREEAKEARAAATEAQKQSALAWQEVQACERRSAELERRLHEASASRDVQIADLKSEIATLREQLTRMLGNSEGA